MASRDGRARPVGRRRTSAANKFDKVNLGQKKNAIGVIEYGRKNGTKSNFFFFWFEFKVHNNDNVSSSFKNNLSLHSIRHSHLLSYCYSESIYLLMI